MTSADPLATRPTGPQPHGGFFDDPDRTPVAPAPWVLHGQGVIVVLRDRAPRPSRPGAFGRFSLVMFVDYSASPVGPYQELLFIPRVERWPDVIGGTVEDIWVTSQASALNGNENWGLTKSVADIRREPTGDGDERWTAEDESGPLAAFTHRPRGVKFPVAKPRNLARLVQRRDGLSWVTPVSLLAWTRLSSVSELWLDPVRVMDTERHRPIAAVQITSGRLGFHEGKVRPIR
jgi:hypothetical protein